MFELIGVYHAGIPVDVMDRAERFYTEVMGMKLDRRIDDETGLQSRLECGQDVVVLFPRPRELGRKRIDEDGIVHHAFLVERDSFDEAIAQLQDLGCLDYGPVTWPGETGPAAYFFDSEGNYLEICTR